MLSPPDKDYWHGNEGCTQIAHKAQDSRLCRKLNGPTSAHEVNLQPFSKDVGDSACNSIISLAENKQTPPCNSTASDYGRRPYWRGVPGAFVQE